MNPNHSLVAITGLGMISCLGPDVETSCAAARAGISRTTELEFSVVREEDNDREVVAGHGIPGLAVGFEGIGRTLRIARLAAVDLSRRADLARLNPERCGLILALPDFGRASRPAGKQPSGDLAYKNPLLPTREALLAQERSAILSGIRQSLGHLVPDRNMDIVQAGHAGFAIAADRAMGRIRSGEWDRCVIGAFDSLLEFPTLQWLSDHRRLKTCDNPVGLQPGEAGAFVVIESLQSALARNATVCGLLTASAAGLEDNHQFSGEPPLGKGFVETLEKLMPKLPDDFAPGWIVSDLNGEVYRSLEWGNALVRLIKLIPMLSEAELVCPALSFGDTEAASGAVNLCLAVRALSRGYAPPGGILILSSSATGERGALHVQKVN